MSKINSFILASLLLAQTALADTCSVKLTGVFTPEQAKKLCSPYGGTSLLFSVSASGTPVVGTSSVDAADSNNLVLTSSNAATTDGSRGGTIYLRGNEVATTGGSVSIIAGNASTANLNLIIEDSSSGVVIKDLTSGNLWTFGNNGNLTSDGTNGNNIVFGKSTGGVRYLPGTLAAAGSVQGDAAAIADKVTTVTAADATKGVILPATPSVGDYYEILNTAAAVLKIYPGTGDQINATAANTAVSVAASVPTYCRATSTSQWWCSEGVAP